jgi:hypothetical protein
MAINITYKLAIRNGFVEIPDDFVHRASLTPEQVLAVIPGSVRRREVLVARRIMDQEWIELPAFDTAAGPAQDYYKALRDVV